MTNSNAPWWAKSSELSPYPKKAVRSLGVSSWLAIITLASLVSGSLSYAAFSPDPAKPRPSAFNSVEHPANLDGVLAKCGGVFTFDINRNHYGVIPASVVVDAKEIPKPPMLVPVYGYMSTEGVDYSQKKFFTLEDKLPREQIVRSLYDGTTVIWYLQTALSPEQKTELENFVNKHDNVIAVASKNPLPMNRNYAYSTWGISESCLSFSPAIAFQFLNDFAPKAPGRLGKEAPEAILTPDGDLQAINLPG